SELEEQVAAVWRQVLGVAEVGVHDSFLELGGDSLLATRLMSRLREELAVELPMDRLFAQPTVAAVAEAVVEARAQQAGGEDLARLLAEIGGMSDEELERELTQDDHEELPG
ncbi:MAG TPA: phosphopantetheine-binding protein, partial [Thermoanaerobaculia bacterium]